MEITVILFVELSKEDFGFKLQKIKNRQILYGCNLRIKMFLFGRFKKIKKK